MSSLFYTILTIISITLIDLFLSILFNLFRLFLLYDEYQLIEEVNKKWNDFLNKYSKTYKIAINEKLRNINAYIQLYNWNLLFNYKNNNKGIISVILRSSPKLTQISFFKSILIRIGQNNIFWTIFSLVFNLAKTAYMARFILNSSSLDILQSIYAISHPLFKGLLFISYNLICTLISVIVTAIFTIKNKQLFSICSITDEDNIHDHVSRDKLLSREQWKLILKKYNQNQRSFQRSDFSSIILNVFLSFGFNLILSLLINSNLTKFETILINTVENILRNYIIQTIIWKFNFLGYAFTVKEKCFISRIDYQQINRGTTIHNMQQKRALFY